jgi:hypothetical protein
MDEAGQGVCAAAARAAKHNRPSAAGQLEQAAAVVAAGSLVSHFSFPGSAIGGLARRHQIAFSRFLCHIMPVCKGDKACRIDSAGRLGNDGRVPATIKIGVM